MAAVEEPTAAAPAEEATVQANSAAAEAERALGLCGRVSGDVLEELAVVARLLCPDHGRQQVTVGMRRWRGRLLPPGTNPLVVFHRRETAVHFVEDAPPL